MARPRILVTNDDCYLSKGLYVVYEAVRDIGEARIYSTELPRSAIGHTISFNKPVRLTARTYMGYRVYVTDGTPIDALHLAMSVHGFRPDLVLSGVNVGENLSLQHIYYSGTVAVAVEAALHGIPSVALSADVTGYDEFDDESFSSTVKAVVRALAEKLLERGMPEGIDILSVNFPSPSMLRPCIRLARAARVRWVPEFEQRLDTRGRPYYWLKTIPVNAPEDTDVYVVTRMGCISVTPLKVDMNAQPTGRALKGLETLVNEIEKILRK